MKKFLIVGLGNIGDQYQNIKGMEQAGQFSVRNNRRLLYSFNSQNFNNQQVEHSQMSGIDQYIQGHGNFQTQK